MLMHVEEMTVLTKDTNTALRLQAAWKTKEPVPVELAGNQVPMLVVETTATYDAMFGGAQVLRAKLRSPESMRYLTGG